MTLARTSASVRALGSMLGFAFCLFTAAPARAQAPRRFTLVVGADSSCDARPELLRQIHLRAPRASEVETGPSDVEARVTIVRDATRVRGVVDLSRTDGTTHRQVDGADCSEVTRALALIIALAIDPDADTAPAEPPPPRPLSSAPAPSVPPSRPIATERRPPAAPHSLRLGFGGLLGLSGGVAPDPTPYEGFFVLFGKTPGPLFAPSVRLSFEHASGSTTTKEGHADFDRVLGRLALCPIRLGASWFAEPCGTFDFGRLKGIGSNTFAPRTQSSTFWGPGVEAHAGAVLFGTLSLGVELGLSFPLARDRFFFAPDTTAYRVPTLAGRAGIALGVEL